MKNNLITKALLLFVGVVSISIIYHSSLSNVSAGGNWACVPAYNSICTYQGIVQPNMKLILVPDDNPDDSNKPQNDHNI